MALHGTKLAQSPGVLEKTSRRRYLQEHKERTVREANRCSTLEELGALLRREGLYSGAINRWRKELQESTLSSSVKNNRKEVPAQEISRLKRQNALSAEKLRQAELIIDVQKSLRDDPDRVTREGR